MPLSGQHYIAGHTQRAGTDTFTSTDPRTKQALPTVYADATPAEVDHAVRAAAEAFQETRHYPASRLADFLDAAADAIEALGDELLAVADAETGLGQAPRLAGERGRTTGQIRSFAALLREGSYVEAIIDPATDVHPDIRRMLLPLGPVAVFPPNNFPLAFGVAGGDTASAFAAGCPVIVKAHPSHPGASELVAAALTQAVKDQGFPAGFFSMVQGRSIDVGQALVNHPLLEGVGFTGSLRGGRAIADAAAARPRPIPVYAEMGSVNPVVLLPGAVQADTAALADGLVGSVTLGSGQFCTNPGLVFVIDDETSADFIAQVTRKMADKQPSILLNQAVESGLQQSVAEIASRADVQVLTGGAALEEGGFCYPNTVLQTTSQAFRADPHLQDEHFGPVTLFVKCQSLDDLLATLPALEGSLTATVHAAGSEHEAASAVFDALRDKAGRLLFNGFPTGVAVVHAMHHGGPYPASSSAHFTSVGKTAIKRWLRPVAYQNLPDAMLPDALKRDNPLGIWRIVDSAYTTDAG